MDIINFFGGYSLETFVSLIFFAFLSGFIDAIVGGGGLIQVPALLINLPNTPVVKIFGTNKISAIFGTALATFKYSKKVKYNIKLLFIISFFSGISSYFGATLVSYLDSDFLKKIVFFVLILISIYTIFKKDFGLAKHKKVSENKQIFYGIIMGVLVGFYDGFLGPGTGSFYVLGFVALLGFDFLESSAYSKFVNCITNFTALYVFINQYNFILIISIIMAIGNISGSLIGSNLAIKRGNKFIRKVFIVVVLIMIFRYGKDLFFNF